MCFVLAKTTFLLALGSWLIVLSSLDSFLINFFSRMSDERLRLRRFTQTQSPLSIFEQLTVSHTSAKHSRFNKITQETLQIFTTQKERRRKRQAHTVCQSLQLQLLFEHFNVLLEKLVCDSYCTCNLMQWHSDMFMCQTDINTQQERFRR